MWKLEQKLKKADRKDEGDLVKESRFKKEPYSTNKPKISYPSGDDKNKVNKIEVRNTKLSKANDKVLNNDTPNTLIARIVKAEQEQALKLTKIEKEPQKKTKEKIRIRPKHVANNVIKKEDLTKNICNSINSDKIDEHSKKIIAKDKDDAQDNKSSSNKSTLPPRRPVVKTVTKNDTSGTYKEISFVSNKNKTTTLCVNIPITYNPKASETSTESKPSKAKVKNKSTNSNRNKVCRKRNVVTSPERRGNLSPVTEVAKWVSPPSCLNTKSYHEAWVKSTLEAMSRSKRRDKLYLDKQRVLERFQRSLSKRTSSPELLNNDESIIGKIRVRQR